jgi:hypothetical protein
VKCQIAEQYAEACEPRKKDLCLSVPICGSVFYYAACLQFTKPEIELSEKTILTHLAKTIPEE